MGPRHEKPLTKVLPLITALVPCVISILVVVQRPHLYGDNLTTLLFTNRSEIQIVVQILSSTLGFLQVYSLHALLQLYARSRFFESAVSLRRLSYWIALSTGQINSSLPFANQIFPLLLLLSGFIPGALWAGAITPLLELHQDHTPGSIFLPTFSNRTSWNWNKSFQLSYHVGENCTTFGTLTNCPVPVLSGVLLNAIGSAWTLNKTPSNHAKYDATGWSYLGRSYGVGASIGQVQPQMPPSLANSSLDLQAINYTEHNWYSKVRCIYNLTTAYKLREIGLATGPGAIVSGPTGVYVYIAEGYLPNSFNDGLGEGVGENYTVLSTSDQYMDVLAWSARSIGGENFISIASGPGQYESFNSTQCQIKFNPYSFNVYVNNTAKTIEVTPEGPSNVSAPLLPPLQVAINSIKSVNLLGEMSSSLYTSVLGDALAQNLAIIKELLPTIEDVLQSLEAGFEAALDDISVMYGVSQIFIAQDSVQVPAHATGWRTRIGNPIFIYIITTVSIVLAIAQICCLGLSRFWHGLPAFNIFDIKSAIVAASAGSTGLAEDLRANTPQKGYMPLPHEGPRYVWNGNADNEAVLGLEVVVEGPFLDRDMPRIRAKT